MALNTLEFATLMQGPLDQHIAQEATSGWMEANASEIKYDGGKYIKLPTIETTGLGDYDRDAGFDKQGSVTLTWTQYEMTMDRATTFQLDAMDVNETNFVMNATAVAKEFQANHVIPEIDAYRYATLHNVAKTVTNTEESALTATNALATFREHVRAVEDRVGYGAPLVCTITGEALNKIETDENVGRSITVADFAQGKLNFKVKAIDNVIFRVVPSSRMMSSYVYNDGTAKFGFEAGVDAVQIQWIICPMTTPIAVSRTDKLRVFAPDVNQKADAWKIDYRKYHDLWVKKRLEKSIMTLTAPTI